MSVCRQKSTVWIYSVASINNATPFQYKTINSWQQLILHTHPTTEMNWWLSDCLTLPLILTIVLVYEGNRDHPDNISVFLFTSSVPSSHQLQRQRQHHQPHPHLPRLSALPHKVLQGMRMANSALNGSCTRVGSLVLPFFLKQWVGSVYCVSNLRFANTLLIHLSCGCVCVCVHALLITSRS